MAEPRQTWQRARSPEQKELRRRAILAAAGELLDEAGLEGTGLNAIARRAGLSKPNLYSYFESREAILLRLLLDEAASWTSALARRLDKIEATSRGARVAEIARAYAGAVATVFEHNVEPDTVAAFKREFVATVQPTVTALAALLPLDEEQALLTLAVLMMTTTGMWAHCHPAPAVQTVLARAEFSRFKLDFKETVRAHAEAYLRGRLAAP